MYFDHIFNTSEHLNYVAPLSESKYYGADYMSKEEGTRFFEWYDGQIDKVLVTRSNCLPTALVTRMFCLCLCVF
jgi:hypothetical protein